MDLNEEKIKNAMIREEWKVAEAAFVEIPFSRLKSINEDNNFALNIKDTKTKDPFQEDSENIIATILSHIHPDKLSIQNIILKLAEECLTTHRKEALKLWMMGNNKRDIVKILYPSRTKDFDDTKRTIGIEVYMQRMLNHFIPIAIREHMEKKYPYITHKIFNYNPLHEHFIRKLFLESIKKPGDPFENFMKFYNNNPKAIFMLKDAIRYKTETIVEPNPKSKEVLPAKRVKVKNRRTKILNCIEYNNKYTLDIQGHKQFLLSVFDKYNLKDAMQILCEENQCALLYLYSYLKHRKSS